jgi:2-polyprenyl-6-methoxyphenol hydroxylase-like FAD-dependent oxidoreductase
LSDGQVERSEVPVAIVGGGPVGLALALDLGRYGVECTLIEQGERDVRADNAKAVDVNMRTMEFCRRWGIAEEVRSRGFKHDYPQDTIYVTTLTGHLLARHPQPSFAELRTPVVAAERLARCPQTIFDPILQRTAASFPSVRLRYQTRCEEIRQDAAGTTLALLNTVTGARDTLRAKYVACCDGANSTLRPALGIEMEGAGTLSYNANVVFRSDELLKIHDKGPGFYTAIGPEGRWASILAVDGDSLWRMHVSKPVEGMQFEQTEAEALIRRFAGTDFRFEVVSARVWARREVVASRYQAGRVFLLGDSAHQLPPTGGFGMNTGIGDATNLAWKLAATLDGWGGEQLLASYERERLPVGRRNVLAAAGRWSEVEGRTQPPGPAILQDGPEGEAVRESVTLALEKTINKTNAGYELGARYEDVGLQLGYQYADSPVIVSEGHLPPPDEVRVYSNTAHPGARAPHFWLEHDKSVLDLFGYGFVLLRLSPSAPDTTQLVTAAKSESIPLTVHSFDIPHLLHLYNKRLVLVRPDGHVAWRSDEVPPDSAALLDHVRGARQEKSLETV